MPTIKTHTALGFGCGLAMIIAYRADTYTALSSSVIGAMIADIDTKKSAISSMFPIINVPVDAMTKHRGIVHWGIPLLLMALYLMHGKTYWLYLAVGAVSHLAIDMITKGIGITCNSRGEDCLYNLLWVVNVLLISQMVWPNWWKTIIERVM